MRVEDCGKTKQVVLFFNMRQHGFENFMIMLKDLKQDKDHERFKNS